MAREFKSMVLAGFAALTLVGCSQAKPNADSITFDRAPIDKAMQALVDEGSIAGGSALIYSGQEEVYFGAFGWADREAGYAWERESLTTIFSMTKPITGVTLMSLYEDGLFDLDAPLFDYLPEFKDVKVFEGMGEDGQPILTSPRRPIQVIDIFRHTSCLGYGWGGDYVSNQMNAAQLFDPSKPIAQFTQELARLPLYCHPGEAWKYGVSNDVQASLAEVVTGRDYLDIVQERVLTPLGMSDTSYFVPPADKARLAAVYLRGKNGKLTRKPDAQVYSRYEKMPVQINGGHGLISTLDDYMRFALMLQNEGSLDGVEIIKPETLALMTQNHLPDAIKARDFLPSKGQVGFGLNFAVRTAPPASDEEPFGAEGEFFWDGAASTLFWVDPKNDITAVFYIQVQPFDGAAQARFRRAVYEGFGLTPPQ